MIPETVTLAFDPDVENLEIQMVFANDLARTLWLAVKYSHLTSTSFSGDCLYYAQAIKRAKRKGPLTAGQLLLILSGFVAPPSHGIIGSGELDFATELLPFVNGEKVIKFKVEVKDQTEEEAFQKRIGRLGPRRSS